MFTIKNREAIGLQSYVFIFNWFAFYKKYFVLEEKGGDTRRLLKNQKKEILCTQAGLINKKNVILHD